MMKRPGLPHDPGLFTKKRRPVKAAARYIEQIYQKRKATLAP